MIITSYYPGQGFVEEEFSREKHRPFPKILENIVIKAGSNVLTKEGMLDKEAMMNIVQQIVQLKKKDISVTYVTSGSIAAGMACKGINKRPNDTNDRKAMSAIGQSELMHMYKQMFNIYGFNVGQILLEQTNLNEENGKTFKALKKYGAIPIINANDPVWDGEVNRDNDTLAAKTAQMLKADLLIILTDEKGMYTANPKTDSHARLISYVGSVDEKILKAATNETNANGTGGMLTKISLGKFIKSDWMIFDGIEKDSILNVLNGNNIGTYIRNCRTL